MFRFRRLYCTFIVFTFLLSLPFSLTYAETSVHLDAARAAMQQEDWEAANYEWRHILDQDPQNTEAMTGLGESLYHTGFYQEASALLEGIPVKKRPVSAELTLARTYTEMRDLLQSRDTYLRILGRMPFNLQAFKELHALSSKLAAGEREPALRKMGEVARAAKSKGEKSAMAGRFSEAASYFNLSALQLHTVGLYNDYALLLLLSGQYEKAYDQYLLLKKKGKLHFAEVNSNAAVASLSMGNYAEAKVQIQEAIRQIRNAKRKAQLYNNYGYILEMSRKRQEAKFAYEHALSLDPTLLMAQLNLAFVQQADREYAAAIENYRNILKQHPENTEVWNRLGFVYELQYRSRPAVAAYRKAIEINPKYPESYKNLATLYKKMGKLTEAHETLRQLAELAYEEEEKRQPEKPVNGRLQKNPMKYVVLFPSDGRILSSIH